MDPSERPVYVSVDVETLGIVPGLHPLLAVGAAAFLPYCMEPLETFQGCLKARPNERIHEDTMDWWMGQTLDAIKAATSDPQSPREIAQKFERWLNRIAHKAGRTPVIVTWRSFDQWWLHHLMFTELGHADRLKDAIDIRSFVLPLSGLEPTGLKTQSVPEGIRQGESGDHTALGDALVQGRWFMRALARYDGTEAWGKR